jgi:hypothetical protein
MTLSFPNSSRSFDEANNRVRFWGYDSAIEISFIVEGDALKKCSPHAGGAEAALLKAFDAERQRIQEVAEKVYSRGRKSGSYSFVLMASDF